MDKNVRQRIDRLKSMIPKPMTVICKLPTGEETVLTVDECIQAKADFVRVNSGSRLEDAHRLLDYMCGPNCVID